MFRTVVKGAELMKLNPNRQAGTRNDNAKTEQNPPIVTKILV